MKKKALLILFALAALGAGTFYAARRHFSEGARGNAITLYGNVEERHVDAAFMVSERLAELFPQEGASVRRGEVIGRLETVRVRNDLAVARAEAEAIRAELAAAEKISVRYRKLRKSGGVSVQDAETAEASALSLRAKLAAAEATVAIREQTLRDTELFAPCDGVVRERLVEPGETVSPQKPVLRLAIVSPKWVRVWIPEPLLTKIVPGAEARVRFDGAETEFLGRVGFVSPNAEFTPKNVETAELRTSLLYECRIFVEDPENRLKLGAPATAIFGND